ncbi:Pleiotropic drug resistance protein 2 [Capsicum chinense]|nr:Pleiotropic drug resistance protein 2 [Capsicum chinense]
MSASISKDELAKSLRMSFGSASERTWTLVGVREVFTTPGGDVFQRNVRENDDKDELNWAAIERLSTYELQEVDVMNLGLKDKKELMESILRIVEQDNEKFLLRLRDRIDRVGIDILKVEVRFEHLSIEGDAYVGSGALPTLWNATINFGALEKIKIVPSKKRVIKILRDVSGIVKPSRRWKTTLLKALAAVPDKDLRVAGKISYGGHELSEFIPQRTCAYISQHDLHHGEMTVRETLDFAGRSVGVRTRYELLAELSRREKELGIKPDPEIDVLMKATAVAGQESSLVTGYVLKILGLDTCADIMIGDQMRRVLLSSFTAHDFWNSGILNMSWSTCTRLFDMF